MYAMRGHVTSDSVFGQLINETMLPGSNYIAKYKDKAEVHFFHFHWERNMQIRLN